MRFLDRLNPSRRIGAFEVIEQLGEGGMSRVYLARQASLDRPVAIKVLKEKLGGDAFTRERFERESLIVAHLNHPNIVHVIDRGITRDGSPYFVMEHLDGNSLAAVLAEGPLPPTRAIEIGIQVCRALAYAHRNGVIHRDIKPANIQLDREGNAIVLDFGIAKLAGPTNETRADLILGTLAYMSPEQQSGASQISPASDLYSLGVVLYEMVTKLRPVGRFRRPSECAAGVSPALDEVILRCLEAEPERRFKSADELRDQLLTLLQGAHLDTETRARAGSGLERAREKFALLDVIRESPGGGVYLYQNRADQRLLIIRKRMESEAGLAEARILSALSHRHVAAVMGASGGPRCFIVVMEYLAGGSLRDRLVQPLPIDEVLRIGREAAEGLAFAHHNRIFHGSLGPGNLLFTGSESVKLADFGFDEHREASPYNPFSEPRSVAADLLALGIILHQAATGVLPGWKGDELSLYPQFLRLPEEARAAISRLLVRKPSARIPSGDLAAIQLHRARGLLVDGWNADGSTEIRGRLDRDEGPEDKARVA